jgi:tetratricopeptide (TPR) repeat protein
MNLKRIIIFFMTIIILFCFLQIQLNAQTADEYFRSAEKALSEERYEAAFESIQKAIQLNPEELEYKYFLALILIKQKKLEQAHNILNDLILTDENRYGKAYFDLEGIYREQKRHEDAISALKKAEKVDRERALLEQGYTYLEAFELNKAIEKFEEVKKSPRFEQSAIYNLGIAYHRKSDYKKALSHATEAVQIAPETGIAQNAKFLIETIKKEMKLRKPFSLIISSTNQYDDNVIIQPLEQIGLQKIGIPPSKQADYASSLAVKLGYKPYMRRNWDINLEAAFFQSFYSKLKTNNLTAFMPAARFNFFHFPFALRFSYTFGRFLVDNKLYAQVHSISPVVSLSLGQYGRSELMFQTDIRRYLDGMTPDADHFTIGYTQFFNISKVGEPRLGYKYEIEDNKEDKGDFFSHEFLFGIAIPFILKTYLNLGYSYYIRNFKFTEVISPTDRRKDNQHFIYVFLSRYFGRYFAVNFTYGYTLSNSNIGIIIPDFDYFDPYHWRKNIVSLSITMLY